MKLSYDIFKDEKTKTMVFLSIVFKNGKRYFSKRLFWNKNHSIENDPWGGVRGVGRT